MSNTELREDGEHVAHEDHVAARYLSTSLLISTGGVVISVIGWWVVRFYNASAAREGRHVKDLMVFDWSDSTLPFLLFVMFVVGVGAFALALIGARAVGSEPWQVRPWKAVVAGGLAAMIAMVPLVVLANTWVTAGLGNVGGD